MVRSRAGGVAHEVILEAEKNLDYPSTHIRMKFQNELTKIFLEFACNFAYPAQL